MRITCHRETPINLRPSHLFVHPLLLQLRTARRRVMYTPSCFRFLCAACHCSLMQLCSFTFLSFDVLFILHPHLLPPTFCVATLCRPSCQLNFTTSYCNKRSLVLVKSMCDMCDMMRMRGELCCSYLHPLQLAIWRTICREGGAAGFKEIDGRF